MKIRLNTLGFECVPGVLRQPKRRTGTGSSTADYQPTATAIDVSEIYLQDSDGIVAGERLGVEHRAWIPYRVLNQSGVQIKIARADKIVIAAKNREYDVEDVKEQERSYFENHYELKIVHKND